MFLPPPPSENAKKPPEADTPQPPQDVRAFARALKTSGAMPDEVMEVLLDSGVSPALATQVVTDLFPGPSRKGKRRGHAGRGGRGEGEPPIPPREGPLDRVTGWLGYADCVKWNKAGFVLLLLGFGLGFVLCSLGGVPVPKDRLLLVSGPITTALDLAYRRYSAGGHWLLPDSGGRFLFLPVWAFGIFWFILGACGGRLA